MSLFHFGYNSNNTDKYPDSKYEDNLRKGERLQENNIIPLLEWKNGRRLSGSKKRIAHKMMENIQEFNQFRSLITVKNEDYNGIWRLISSIINSGLVWKVFLLHISRPDDYPMVDQHVLRAYHFLIHDEILEPEQTPEIYHSYKEFFIKVARESGKNFRVVDKALMSFGQYLKSQFCHLDRNSV